MIIKVGTCGWSARGGRKNYYKHFSVVELQDVFYRLPKEDTARKWRAEAPESFEFTLKAWQAITHPPSSPTWRRNNLKVSKEEYDKYGFFRPTEKVFNAWNLFKKIAEILKAKIIVFQTPPSFKCTEENISNMKSFFDSIERKDFILCWEPRGDWKNHPKKLKKILVELELVHVVDILRYPPLVFTPTLYFRLHGLDKGEVNYRYKYKDSDLEKLRDLVYSLSSNVKQTYIMFNNIYMFQDALRFKEFLGECK
ncbi:MAG: hypothetical protein B6U94_01270 [Thermofilum sp. ex4484_79]|nr:MAG: hypothetical protein B6U94_01270 [Thermofilum sp. ex4484_79]